MVSKDRALECTRHYLDKLHPNAADTTSKQKIMEDLRSGKTKLQSSQLCRLWAGMGSIYKVSIDTTDSSFRTATTSLEFVIKHVTPPPRAQQSLGDRRKAASYQVEANFYQHVAPQLLQKDDILVMPTPYHVEYGPKDDEITIAMSHLEGKWIDNSREEDVHGTLQWLAHFHASYWGMDTIDELVNQVGLQEMGSYWHLETRPDEHASMSSKGWQGRLKRAAQAIDACLKRDSMQCLIHGDPKDANVMKLAQSNHGHNNKKDTTTTTIIAMYDFQYCGKGTPTRDLAYFLCSSCDPEYEAEYIHYYHAQLSELLQQQGMDPPTWQHFEKSLLLAFCDFYRFLCGWGQWGYDLRDKVMTLLDTLDHGQDLGSEQAYHEAIRQEFW